MQKLLYLLPLPLVAQDTLPDIVVTASRTTEKANDEPYTAEILTAEQLKEKASRTLPQALLDTPGVLVQQTTPGHGSPYVRGFTGRQNLLLLDGVRLNNSTWRGGPVQYWNTLDSQAIARLELIKSQGSVLYGSDAIGGTLNTLSKSSGFRDKEGFFSGGAAYYRFDTNSESHLGRLEQRLGVGGEWGLMLGASAKDIGDIKDSALGRMRNTGYREQSFDFKFEYAFSDSRTLTLAHTSLNQDDVPRWHSTVDSRAWFHGSSFTTAGTDLERTLDQERSLTYLRLEDSESAISWIDEWQTTLSYQKTQDSEFRVRSSGRIDERILDLDTYGLTFQAKSGPVVWGADFYHDEVSSEGRRNGANRPQNRPVADDASYDSLGLFANYSGEIGQRFSYDAGARFTYARADWDGYRPAGATVDQSGDASWENLSLSLRAKYEISETWQLFGGLSQSFRAPNLDDLTGQQFALNGLDSSGSPDVDPETYLTAEIGTRYDNGDLSLKLSAFHTWIDDGIVRVSDGSGGLVTTNGSDGYLYGFEASVAYQLADEWRISAYASWNDGKQEQGGMEDTIRRLIPLSGGLEVKWTHPSEKFWISGNVRAATKQDNLSRLAASDTQRVPVNGTPGYIIPSIYAGWTVSENLSVNFAFENLTDEDYRIHGSGQNQAGRNATVSVRYEW